MEEKFIELKISEEEKDKNVKNNSAKSQNKKQIFSYNIPMKRRVCEFDKKFFTVPKIPDTFRFIFDKNIPPNKSSKNINISNANEYEGYQVIEMNIEDKILMTCYEYLKNNQNLKEQQIITLNILDKEITFTLLEIHKNKFFPILLNSKLFNFENNAREISFVNEKTKKITKRFIYNSENLKNCLNDLGFKSYYVKKAKDKIDNNIINLDSIKPQESDSESSEVSLDPFKIFIDHNINCIFNENQRPILNDDNFNKRFKTFVVKLKDLNNNSKYYYKYSDNIFNVSNNYEETPANFRFFRYSWTTKIVYLYGPKRSSKTTFLLYMINLCKFIEARTLYFNYNYIENINILERKRIIYHELLYFSKKY